MATVEIAKGKFVYPFVFDLQDHSFEDRCVQICAAFLEHEGKKNSVWELTPYNEYDLLPHVAKYILPGDQEGKVDPDAESLYNVGIWKLADPVLQSSNFGLGSGKGGGSFIYKLVYRQKELGFKMLRVDLFLFRTGMGAISFEVEPELSGIGVDGWFDFLHFFRFFDGMRKVSITCSRTGFDQEKRERVLIPDFPPIAARGEEAVPGEGVFSEIVFGLLGTANMQDQGAPWWEDIFIPGQFLPFSILFARDLDPEKYPNYIYQLRKGLHSQQTLVPPVYELSLEHEGVLEYTRDQWFVFSLDGGGFIAFDPPDDPFFQTDMPIHLMNMYFLVFILTTHQRFALTHLADQIARIWLEDSKREQGDSISENTMRNLFTVSAAIKNLSNSMQRDNLQRVYQRWRSVYQIEQLYATVVPELRYLSTFFQARIDKQQGEQSQRLERWVAVLTFLIGIPAILLPFLEFWDVGRVLSTWITAGGFALGGLGVWLISRRRRRD